VVVGDRGVDHVEVGEGMLLSGFPRLGSSRNVIFPITKREVVAREQVLPS
jgi:hypothetical protein